MVRNLSTLDWATIAAELDGFGHAVVKHVLTPAECRAAARLYDRDELFRSHIVMARHGFGRGEYKYFAYPLPEIVTCLRSALYPPLAAIANRWNAAMGVAVRYPDEHASFLERCHRAGQTKPTPLLLQYARVSAPGRVSSLAA